MVLKTETKQLIKKLGIKLGLGLLGFTAAFVASHIGLFNLDTTVSAFVVAMLDDVAEWANSRYDVAGRVASAFVR